MKLEYSLSTNDFLEHQLYIASKSRRIIKKRQKQRMIVPIIYLGLGIFAFSIHSNYVLAILFLLFAILWFAFYPIRSKKLHIKHYKSHIDDNYKNRVNKLTEIEIKDDYIFGKDSASESKTKVEEIESLIELKKHFFLKTKTDVYLIIPKIAIENIDLFKKEILKLNIPIIDELDWEFK